MNRRLIIMRHASSAPAGPGQNDHARELDARGPAEAAEVARALHERQWVPRLVLCSDATRTQQTWEHMAAAFDPAPEVRLVPNLYHGGMDELYFALADVADDVTEVLVLGHNPGWEQAVAYLCGHAARMDPASAALLESESHDWLEALSGPRLWRLVELVRPGSQ